MLLHSGAFLTHSAEPSQVTLVLLIINYRSRSENKKKEKIGYTDTVQSCAPSALYLTGIDFPYKYFNPHIALPFSIFPVFAK